MNLRARACWKGADRMDNERKIPPALNLYSEACEVLRELDPVEAGNVMLAAIDYYFDGVLPDDLDRVEAMVFSVVRKGIDYSFQTYRERCRKNAENARKRSQTTAND